MGFKIADSFVRGKDKGSFATFKSERGASLVEVMVSASILAITATMTMHTASNTATLAAIDEGHKAVLTATSRVDAETRLIMKDTWKNDLCLAAASLQSKLSTRSSYVGDRTMTIRPLNSATAYTGVTNGGVPSEWSTAIAACNSPAGLDGCMEIVMAKGTAKVSQGFVVLRLVPWDFKAGTAPSTCTDDLETQAGMGYRLNNALFLESKLPDGSIHRVKHAYQAQFANAVDGDGFVPSTTTPPTGLQGPNMLWGWRANWPLPPAPGAAYTAWPVPYKQSGSWAVPVGCFGFNWMFPSSACRPYAYLDWTCDGTLFAGAKCEKHSWFK